MHVTSGRQPTAKTPGSGQRWWSHALPWAAALAAASVYLGPPAARAADDASNTSEQAAQRPWWMPSSLTSLDYKRRIFFKARARVVRERSGLELAVHTMLRCDIDHHAHKLLPCRAV
jgi:hypothetical protein